MLLATFQMNTDGLLKKWVKAEEANTQYLRKDHEVGVAQT